MEKGVRASSCVLQALVNFGKLYFKVSAISSARFPSGTTIVTSNVPTCNFCNISRAVIAGLSEKLPACNLPSIPIFLISKNRITGSRINPDFFKSSAIVLVPSPFMTVKVILLLFSGLTGDRPFSHQKYKPAKSSPKITIKIINFFIYS